MSWLARALRLRNAHGSPAKFPVLDLDVSYAPRICVKVRKLNQACQEWWGYSGSDGASYSYSPTYTPAKGVKRVIYAGDSLTAGTGTSKHPQGPGSTDWPTQLHERYAKWAVIPRVNQAHGGHPLTGSHGIALKYDREIHPWRPLAGERVYLVLQIGTNDLVGYKTSGNLPVTGCALIAAATNYIRTAHTDGFHVILLNIPNASGPGNATSAYTKEKNAQREYFNAHISHCDADVIADVDRLVTGNTSYIAKVGSPHFNDAGYALFAQAVNAAVPDP